MPLAELMSQIQELPKIDKLRLIQFLATELVKEEDANFFVANKEYPVTDALQLLRGCQCFNESSGYEATRRGY